MLVQGITSSIIVRACVRGRLCGLHQLENGGVFFCMLYNGVVLESFGGSRPGPSLTTPSLGRTVVGLAELVQSVRAGRDDGERVELGVRGKVVGLGRSNGAVMRKRNAARCGREGGHGAP